MKEKDNYTLVFSREKPKRDYFIGLAMTAIIICFSLLLYFIFPEFQSIIGAIVGTSFLLALLFIAAIGGVLGVFAGLLSNLFTRRAN